MRGARADGGDVPYLDPYRIMAGQQHNAGRMDVVLVWDVPEGLQAVVFDIEPPPFVGFDAWQAEQRRRNWGRPWLRHRSRWRPHGPTTVSLGCVLSWNF
jgi:hypothetical protein